jgi:hypothetical protein
VVAVPVPLAHLTTTEPPARARPVAAVPDSVSALAELVVAPLLDVLDALAVLEESEPPHPATSSAAAQTIAVWDNPIFISLPEWINKSLLIHCVFGYLKLAVRQQFYLCQVEVSITCNGLIVGCGRRTTKRSMQNQANSMGNRPPESVPGISRNFRLH